MLDESLLRMTESQSQRRIYVGNLDTRVTEQLLYELFIALGPIEQCKIILDKTTGQSAGYGFIDFTTRESAQRALHTMNQRNIYDKEIKVNWAVQSAQTDSTCALYVGDLSKDVDDALLFKTFSAFGECIDGRVMWDPETGRTRGYGFVTFRSRENAEKALHGMNGAFLGGRSLKVNWASHKLKTADENEMSGSALMAVENGFSGRVIYVGNLTPDVTAPVLQAKFSAIGQIENVRTQSDKGYAFVTFYSPADAARAIDSMTGEFLNGRPLKCGWGKLNATTNKSVPTPVIVPTMMVPSPFTGMPQQMATIPSPYVHPYAAAPMPFIPYSYPTQQQQQYYPQQAAMGSTSSVGDVTAPGMVSYPPYYAYQQQNPNPMGRPYGQ